MPFQINTAMSQDIKSLQNSGMKCTVNDKVIQTTNLVVILSLPTVMFEELKTVERL